MKKCPWCGKEYPDATMRCPTDGEALPGEEPPPAPEARGSLLTVIPPASAVDPIATPGPTLLTDRQLRIIELVLVVAIAFGGSILASTFYFLGLEPSAPLGSHLMWANGIVLESAALILVWYVLRRRFKTFHDLGLSLSGKDILWSVLLYIVGTLGFYLVYSVIQLAGLTTVTGTTATARVTTTLFGGGFSPLAILFLIVNPAFEEVTVRVM